MYKVGYNHYILKKDGKKPNMPSRLTKYLNLRKDKTGNLPLEFAGELRKIEEKYQRLGISHTEGVWNKDHLKKFDLNKFRGDNIYVWQTRLYIEINYFVSYINALNEDSMGLRQIFRESKSFGVEFYNFNGLAVSRDLIDSIIEINYLEKLLNLSKVPNLQIIDIGAGYGRLALRLAEAYPLAKVACIDAIPLSTCISRIYLKDYIKEKRIFVHELDELSSLERNRIKLAVNVHSFSEMSLDSVAAWVDFLVEKEIEYLFIVPNGSSLTLNDGTDFSLLLTDAGFEIINSRPKYTDEDFAKFGIYPSTYFLLQKKHG